MFDAVQDYSLVKSAVKVGDSQVISPLELSEASRRPWWPLWLYRPVIVSTECSTEDVLVDVSITLYPEL